MARDPLASLVRLRRTACDDAQRCLISCVTIEAQAEAAANEAERTIARETHAASDPDGSDTLVEAFAAWLPEARRRTAEARHRLETLQAETARARATLTACRTALETVETLQKQRREAAKLADQRRWQLELEELSIPVSDATRLRGIEGDSS